MVPSQDWPAQSRASRRTIAAARLYQSPVWRSATESYLSQLAVLSLPILFTAGMSVMDTTDGVLMSKAYNWAFLSPLRKIFYNITTTGLSIAVALVIGTLELLQVLRTLLDLKGSFFDFIGALGYAIVSIFLMAWGTSLLLWKFAHIEKRHAQGHLIHAHEPTPVGRIKPTREPLH